MHASDAPVAALTIVGIVLAVLGLLVGGGIGLIGLGVAALVAAGLIGASASRRA